VDDITIPRADRIVRRRFSKHHALAHPHATLRSDSHNHDALSPNACEIQLLAGRARLAPRLPFSPAEVQTMKRLSLGFALMMMLVANAAFAQKVTTDYNKSANFAPYKTFMWIKEPKTANPLTRQRVIDDVNSALAAKGLQLVTSDADLCIAAHAATKQERTLNTFYNGFGGGWRWRGGFGDATTTVDTYEVGTLVVDIFDARTKAAIWRGTSTKTLSGNPQKNAENLNKAVVKMFKDFPVTAKAN
jgi:hypothetical protein